MLIYLSPSDQVSNTYATGDTNEAFQCRRISTYLEEMLRLCGFDVINDTEGNMYDRVKRSNEKGSDLHICIHTNAFNGQVTGTRIFYCRDNSDGERIAKSIYRSLAPITPGTSEKCGAYPTLYEIKSTKCPCVYIECEFHDSVASANWIIENSKTIAEYICTGLCKYYGVEYKNNVSNSCREINPLYKIQVGCFSNKEYAEDFLRMVKQDYPDAFMVTV